MLAKKKQTRSLTYDRVPEDVKRIADESIGRGTLKSIWNSVVESTPGKNPKFYLILRLVEGEPVGFALFHYAIVRTSAFDYVVGIIDAVCVSSPYRGSGYGAMLTHNVLRRMTRHGVNRVEIMLKAARDLMEDVPGLPMMGSERFLFDLGFKKIAYLDEYWHEDSIDWPYECPVCRSRPDTCTGVLMAVNES